MGFVSITRDLNPTDFVHSLLTTHCPSVPPLFVSRILPVELACAPNLQSFHSVVVPAIESKFKGLDRDTTWKIVFDKHGLTNITKDRAIELAQSTIEERHEVSITDPDIVIMIQITHTICGVSFLPDYDQLAEYNIRKLVSRRAQKGSK
jgi:tRNA(Ser,Leu) C12 N-acetylase TAN1